MATALAVGRGGSVVASRVTLLPMPAGPQVPGWQLARSQYVPVIAIRFWGNGGVQATYRECSHTYLMVRRFKSCSRAKLIIVSPPMIIA